MKSCRRLVWLLAALGCSPADRRGSPSVSAALADTVLTFFDSVSAIHGTHPDTGLLRRLHPPGDTLLFVEGTVVEKLTGDSLFRRVLALHMPVTHMRQGFTLRQAHVVDSDHAVLAAVEDVDWVDQTGAHEWHGILTIVLSRGESGWVIRAYHGARN